MNQFDALVAANRTAEQLEAVLAPSVSLPDRTRRIADVLRDAWPGACLYTCLLAADGSSELAVLDENGQPHTGWQSRLGEAGDVGAWDQLLNGSGRTVLVQPLPAKEGSPGAIGLVLKGEAADAAIAREFLASTARTLALLLASDCCRWRCESLQDDVNVLESLANKGELAGPLSHEFSNFLNVLLLQVAVLEYQFPREQCADLVEIRRQGNLAAEVVNQFHQYRRGEPPPQRQIDLQQIVAETAHELRRQSYYPEAVELVLSPPAGSPIIWGVPADVRRLVRFLILNGARAAALGGNKVIVRVEARAERAMLSVEDAGQPPAPEDLPGLFDLSHSNREGVNALELAACRSLVRRLNGTISAENRPGGLCIVVEFGSRGKT